jgi:tetratricopeptide (TPR) repeat protein
MVDPLPTATATVGGRIRFRRLELALTQAQLAGDDLSSSYISLIESDRRAPGDDVVRLLAQRLRCSPVWLRTGRTEDDLATWQLRLNEAELDLHAGHPEHALEIALALLGTQALPMDVRRGARVVQARALEAIGALEQAVDVLSVLVETARASGEQPELSTVVALSRCLRESGDIGAAIEVASEQLRALEADGVPVDDARIELAATLVGAYNERGDYVLGRRLAERTIAAAERLGSPRARGSAYWNAMLIAVNDGRIGDAGRYAQRALSLYGETDASRNLSRLKVAYAWLLLRSEPPDPHRALGMLEAVGPGLRDEGSVVDQAYAATERARALVQLDELDAAFDAAEEAVALLSATDAAEPVEAARAQAVLAVVSLRRGDSAGAADLVKRASRILWDIGASRPAAEVWRELGEVAVMTGDVATATEAFRNALDAVGVTSPVEPTTRADRVGRPAER